MKTITLTDTQAKRIIKDLARSWAYAATHGAMDDTLKISNDPSNYYGQARRREWWVEKRADAALYSKMLWAFGIETPEIDTSFYLTPMSERSKQIHGAKWKNGFEYHERRRLWVSKCLVAAITGETMPPPYGDQDLEVMSNVLKALNGFVKAELK